MFTELRSKTPFILLLVLITFYSIYFSLFTIFRYEKLFAHYYDLGIMHQTVYNSYMAIKTGDSSRFLEMTDAHGTAEQVKRMSIHNDPLLGLLAPFYFINDTPATILVIQTLVLALGAVFIYLITAIVFNRYQYNEWLGLLFGMLYLLYPPLQKANTFEFHSVTLATTFFLAIYYFWLDKKYTTASAFAVLALLTKEQVGLTLAFLGFYILFNHYNKEKEYMFDILRNNKFIKAVPKIARYKLKLLNNKLIPGLHHSKNLQFAAFLIISGLVWVIISMIIIIPLFRGAGHFGAKYYSHIMADPLNIFKYIFSGSAFKFLIELFSPLAFLSLFSPIHLLIALPEFLVTILSGNENMRNTYFHYESIITSFVFISSIYGLHKIMYLLSKIKKYEFRIKNVVILILVVVSAYSIYYYSHLPGGKGVDLYPWRDFPPIYNDVMVWKDYLDDDQLKVSSSGRLAPHFTSRQYFYNFTDMYVHADYVVIDMWDVENGYLKEDSKPAYNQIKRDKNYIKIYNNNGLEVYKKIST